MDMNFKMEYIYRGFRKMKVWKAQKDGIDFEIYTCGFGLRFFVKAKNKSKTVNINTGIASGGLQLDSLEEAIEYSKKLTFPVRK